MNNSSSMDQVLTDLFITIEVACPQTTPVFVDVCLLLITSPCLCSLLNARSEPLYDQNNIAFVLSSIDGPTHIPRLDRKKLKGAIPVEKLMEVEAFVEAFVEADLLRHLREACHFIKDGVESDKGAALVHCHMGISRSGAVVVGYSEFYLLENQNAGRAAAVARPANLVVVTREYDLASDEALTRLRTILPLILSDSARNRIFCSRTREGGVQLMR